MIDIRLPQTNIVVGETLEGTLIWHRSNSKVPKKATISIRWYTKGRGTRNTQTVQEFFIDPNQLISSQGVPIPFSLHIPYDAPITYNGFLIQVIWELKAFIEMPGLLTRGEKQKCQFQVTPRQAK